MHPKLAESKNAEIREKVLQLSVLFGDPQALAALRQTAADPKADAAARRHVLQQTQNEVVRLDKNDIEERQLSRESMMPDGLLAMLSSAEVRDLIAYVSGT
ncbi:MAG: hypothetical protein ACYC3I_13365 [Gemmataceae bacterium]